MDSWDLRFLQIGFLDIRIGFIIEDSHGKGWVTRCPGNQNSPSASLSILSVRRKQELIHKLFKSTLSKQHVSLAFRQGQSKEDMTNTSKVHNGWYMHIASNLSIWRVLAS